MTLPPSLEQWPPTVTAAVWKALEDRSERRAQRSSVPSEEATRVSGTSSQIDPDLGCCLHVPAVGYVAVATGVDHIEAPPCNGLCVERALAAAWLLHAWVSFSVPTHHAHGPPG